MILKRWYPRHIHVFYQEKYGPFILTHKLEKKLATSQETKQSKDYERTIKFLSWRTPGILSIYTVGNLILGNLPEEAIVNHKMKLYRQLQDKNEKEKHTYAKELKTTNQ